MTFGYAGKILHINLTRRTIHTLDTAQYKDFCGGNGIASALFWDLCPDKAISGFDPGNVIIVMTGPLAGTLTPGNGRTEICGISPFSYPVEWYSRSSIGGFFSSMLKYGGWDGIAIEGRADRPVWINIINDLVTIDDARGLWGLTTVASQREIWKRVTGRDGFGDWFAFGNVQTTQGPSILCIGPAGESMSRMGTIQSGNGMAAGQGGFGGVWGSKNLKAISVIGTGGIKIADPVALLNARKWLQSAIGHKIAPKDDGRQTSCAGCFQKCKSRNKTGDLNDSQCLDSMYKTDVPRDGMSGSDTIQNYGLNLNDLTSVKLTDGVYIHRLYEAGILGPGKQIDSYPLPMNEFGSAAFTKVLCESIAQREGIGAELSEGLMRAALKWGRLEQDLESGLLQKAHWGYGWHWSLPYVEQAYGSLMGDREVTEHAFSSSRVMAYLHRIAKQEYPVDKLVQTLCDKLIPFDGDPLMLDYSWQNSDGSGMKQSLDTGIYSSHKAKFVAWHRHYTRFWSESVLYCDLLWPSFFRNAPDFSGLTPESEPLFFNAVTGKNLDFADGMETGRKIWNLNRAIWILQGRHRDLETFAPFMYTPKGSLASRFTGMGQSANPPLPVLEKGEWKLKNLEHMFLDKKGFEAWKTAYYKVEGWNNDTGWPTRAILENLGLKNVADTLEKEARLGK